MSLSPQELKIVEYGKANGKSKDEVISAIEKFRATSKSQQPIVSVPRTQVEPSLQDRLANIGDTAMSDIKSKILGTGENANKGSIERGVGTVATAFNVVPQAAVEFAPIPIRNALGALGEGYTKVINWLGDKLGSTKFAQDFVTQHPEAAKNLEATLNTLNSGSQIANDILFVKGLEGQIKKGSTGISNTINKINQVGGSSIDTASNIIGSGIDKTAKLANDITGKVVNNISEKNVSPQLQTSVENLTKNNIAPQVRGSVTAVKDPLNLYNEFAKQEEAFKTNIKADTALNVVGERTGNAFEKVIKTRQNVGKIMGEELKKVGNIKTNTVGAFEDFLSELRDSGVSYDTMSGKLQQLEKQTKFTVSDKAQLQYYAKEFQKLGTNPTVAELDAFMSRIPKAIDVYKASKSIVGTTNAERIIKGSLADLRKSLLNSGNPILDKYALARSQYSKLSDFINEGASYLGKKTASGDFSKDASIAKSSVQSILNGGKKDWLIKLEQLTGYKALDEAVIALQAMKDAGNFRGASLLDLLSPTEIPTSKASLVNKAIEYAMKKGTSKLVGSPTEQTRRFIQEAINAQKQSASNAIPNGGQSTINMSKSSNSIPFNYTTYSPKVQRVLNITQSAPNNIIGQPRIIDIQDFEKAKDLPKNLRDLENKAFDYIIKNEDNILNEYFAKYGKEINADNFRPLLKKIGYTSGELAAGVQEPVSYLAKRARSIALKNDGKYVIGTAGGSGVGKSSAAKSIPEIANLQKKAAMILDSNFSTLKSAQKFIEEAKANGKDFIGVFTYRDFLDSMVNGVVKRMLKNKEEMGRLVPTKIVAGNHIDSWDVVKTLYKDKGVIFKFIDNSLGAGKSKLVSFEELAKKIKYTSKEDLLRMANEEIKRLYEQHIPFIDESGIHYINKDQYKALIQ